MRISKKTILILLFFIGLIVNLKNVMAYEPTSVSNNVTINISHSGDAFFDSIKTLEIEDETIAGIFWGSGEPINKNIIPESVVLDSNKGNLKYLLGSEFIDIFVDGENIKFEKNDPLIIHLQYQIKEFLIYDNQSQLYYISQPFYQYNRSTIPRYYNLSIIIIFPFDLYPTSDSSYMPFICYPVDELARQENFSVILLQETPPILQFDKTLYEEGEDLFITSFFDLLPNPPKMQMEIHETLDLETAKYETKTKVTNFYPYELCYLLTKNKDQLEMEIKDCKTNQDIIEIIDFYHLEPSETSQDFTNSGYVNKKPCNNSIIESFYPFECFYINKNVPIKTTFYPEKLQKDFNLQYYLNMESSRGFENKSFDLRILPETMTLPNISGFGCRIFKPLDYPTLEEKDLGVYSAKISTKIFQPTTTSMLSYTISVVRSPIRIWLPIIFSILLPITAFFVRKWKRLQKKSYYIALYTLTLIPLFALCLNLGATPEDFFQPLSLPLILLILCTLIVVTIDFNLIKKLKKLFNSLTFQDKPTS